MFDSFKMRGRLKDLEEGLETVQRHLKRLEIEWADTLDRLRSVVGRIAKDRERAEKARGEAPTSDVQPLGDAMASPLSTRQEQINAAIIARRRRPQ